jgi:hypothetical protein
MAISLGTSTSMNAFNDGSSPTTLELLRIA